MHMLAVQIKIIKTKNISAVLMHGNKIQHAFYGAHMLAYVSYMKNIFYIQLFMLYNYYVLIGVWYMFGHNFVYRRL